MLRIMWEQNMKKKASMQGQLVFLVGTGKYGVLDIISRLKPLYLLLSHHKIFCKARAWSYVSEWRPEVSEDLKWVILQGGFFDWSALKILSPSPLRNSQNWSSPKKRLRMKKVQVPELVLLFGRNSSNTLIVLVKIYLGLTHRTFREEQLAVSSYIVIFRADQ